MILFVELNISVNSYKDKSINRDRNKNDQNKHEFGFRFCIYI